MRTIINLLPPVRTGQIYPGWRELEVRTKRSDVSGTIGGPLCRRRKGVVSDVVGPRPTGFYQHRVVTYFPDVLF